MPESTDAPRLSSRFAEAFTYARELHHRQVRKGGDTPYLAHLMIVAGTVLEHGGDEDVAIAALLHDAAEDQGGQRIVDAIRARFGDRVADTVAGCSDSLVADDSKKPPWRERKDKYLSHFAHASADTRLVSMADKLHNCRTTVADLHAIGAAVWSRFNATREEQLWFYRTFVDAARAEGPPRLVAELERVVQELERLA